MNIQNNESSRFRVVHTTIAQRNETVYTGLYRVDSSGALVVQPDGVDGHTVWGPGAWLKLEDPAPTSKMASPRAGTIA